jgi:hypothetical protein
MNPVVGSLRFNRHARDRMLAFGLDVSDVRAALEAGETVEKHEDGSELVLGPFRGPGRSRRHPPGRGENVRDHRVPAGSRALGRRVPP